MDAQPGAPRLRFMEEQHTDLPRYREFTQTQKGNIMKTVITLAALLVSTAAFAGDVDPNGFEKQHFASSISRTEVVADLKLAQQQGQLPIGELGTKAISEPSTKSRAQVAAEARSSVHSYGELGQASVE
jgi:Domain of unknown function (DUF4148)